MIGARRRGRGWSGLFGVSPWLIVTTCALLVTAVVAVGVHAAAADPGSATTALTKPPIPADGAYLGAYVYPTKPATGAPASSVPSEQAQTSALDAAIKRPLGIDNHFYPWGQLAIGPAQFADAQVGTVPMLSWECFDPSAGDDSSPGEGGDAAIISGAQDSVIHDAAVSIKNFGHPVIVRYSWEMNLNSARNQGCQGALGPAGYVLAWQHIYDIFQQVGATNAAFAWVVSSAVPAAAADQYYPGDAYVDWVGADGYSRLPKASSFQSIFAAFYKEWAGRKPIMIGETGVQSTYQGTSAAALAAAQAIQAQWITSMSQALSDPTVFPDIHAVSYFDSFTSLGDYTLGGAAEDAFATAGALPYFQPASPVLPLAFTSHDTEQKPALGQMVEVPVGTVGSPAATLGVGGTLPPGVQFALLPGGESAVFTGRPQQPGLYSVPVTATSSMGTVEQTYSFEIDGAPTIKRLPTSLGGPVGALRSFPVVTHAYPSDTVTVSGLPANFAFHPDGAGGGVIVGTPARNEGGAYPFTITASNALGSTSQAHRLVVAETATVTTTDALPAYVGTEFSTTVGTLGYPAPSVYVAQLPSWLHAVDNKDGTATLRGVPLRPTVFTIRVVMTQNTYTASGGGKPAVKTSSVKTSYDIIVTVHG